MTAGTYFDSVLHERRGSDTVKNRQEKAPAIVIGGHFQGLGTVRALACKGVRVYVADHEPNLSRFSRFLSGSLKMPDIRMEAQALQCFLEWGNKPLLRGAVIYPTDDESVHFLSRNHKLLSRCFRLMTPDWSSIAFVYDKRETYKQAAKLGIPIPQTFFPGSFDDLEDSNIPFPAVVKPAVMRPFFRKTGKKVFPAYSRDELRRAYASAAAVIPSSEIIVQELIPDVAANLFSFCPFFKNTKSVAGITAQRLRQHPMDFGQASTYVEIVNIPLLKKISEKFLRSIDYYGLAEVEFIRDPRDEQFKMLEINPRIWGWHSLAVGAGVNLPWMVYHDLVIDSRPNTGRQALHVKTRFRPAEKWVRLTTDVPTAALEILRGRMRINQYIQSMKGKKEFAVWSLRDPLPFFGEWLLLAALWKKRGF
ncbi:MAG TPA: ATP-grasp domain-containing protein [bacterium]|nr:ATP-grasp domain-containing protein [bacterium]